MISYKLRADHVVNVIKESPYLVRTYSYITVWRIWHRSRGTYPSWNISSLWSAAGFLTNTDRPPEVSVVSAVDFLF